MTGATWPATFRGNMKFPGSASGDLSLFATTTGYLGLHLGYFSSKREVIPGQCKSLHQTSLCSWPLYTDYVYNIALLTLLPDSKGKLPRICGRWLRIQETHQHELPGDWVSELHSLLQEESVHYVQGRLKSSDAVLLLRSPVHPHCSPKEALDSSCSPRANPSRDFGFD